MRESEAVGHIQQLAEVILHPPYSAIVRSLYESPEPLDPGLIIRAASGFLETVGLPQLNAEELAKHLEALQELQVIYVQSQRSSLTPSGMEVAQALSRAGAGASR